MYELLKKGKDEHTTNTTSSKKPIKNTFDRSNSMWNTNSGANIHDCKGHKVVQMMLYNTVKKGTPVNNVADLNEYIEQVLCGELIVTYDMLTADREEVDEAIRELDSQEFDSVNKEDMVTVIQGKIRDLASRRTTAKQTEKENERQRILALSARLEKMFQEVESNKGGCFVGNPEKWHIHTRIKKEHLKYGIASRSRCNIDCNDPGSIISAVIALNYTGGGEEDKKQCYCWLRYTIINNCDLDLPEEYRVDV